MDDSRKAPVTQLRIRVMEMREALVENFRAGRLPPLPEAMATVYERAGESQRAALLSTLLTSVGPLALAVLAAGRFAKYMSRERWADVAVPLEEARSVTGSQVTELARYAEQSNPDVVSQVSAWLAIHPGVLVALGAGALTVLLTYIAERRRTGATAVATATPAGPASALADPDWLDD